MTPEQGMELAIARFDEALQLVGGSASGEGRSIRNMALVGRARANLHFGNGAQVVADASQLDRDFERLIDRYGINAFRCNQVFHRSNEDDAYSVSNLQSTYREVEIDGYWTLTVDGVPDPRVRSTGAPRSGPTSTRPSTSSRSISPGLPPSRSPPGRKRSS